MYLVNSECFDSLDVCSVSMSLILSINMCSARHSNLTASRAFGANSIRHLKKPVYYESRLDLMELSNCHFNA